jgi:hypothetical protein
MTLPRLSLIAVFVSMLPVSGLTHSESWLQWGRDAQHMGFMPVVGQFPRRILADIVYDPFSGQEQAEAGGSLLTHFQAPLVDGRDVFMTFKSGTYVSCSPPGSGSPFPCGPFAWDRQTWNVTRLHWSGRHLAAKWTTPTDWKPIPNVVGLLGWEPVFHPALSKDFVYMPGAGGTVWRVNRHNGKATRLNPFGGVIDPLTFVAGPLTIDRDGNLYYNVLKGDPFNPSGGPPTFTDIPGAWLVRISRPDSAPGTSYEMVSYKTLIPDAPTVCNGVFTGPVSSLPPSSDAVPPLVPCGSQRPGVNVAPAVAADGTVYVASRAHGVRAAGERYSYLIALNPDLTLKWAASLRDRLNDGCNNDAGTFVGAWFGPNGTAAGCRLGTSPGVDPLTNERPAGRVTDLGTSSPVVAPDGSVLYGAFTAYNGSRGHLFRFTSEGELAGVYGYGWDITPAIYPHDGTFSVIIKDNTYGVDSHGHATGPFYIRQLSSDLRTVEWTFQSTNTESCRRNLDGTLDCVSDHPNGFEWCINAPAVDALGNVYANSEDGRLYVIAQGGTEVGSLFTNLALGAAYTPLALGDDGRIYTQNDGHLFVIGDPEVDRR